MAENEKKIKLSTMIYSIIVIAAVYVIMAGIAIYVFGANGKIIEKTANIIPYPAAIVNNTGFITLRKFDENIKSVKMFYENQDFSDTGLRVDFSTDDGKKRLMIKKKNLLNKMIDNLVIEDLANERGERLSDEIIAQEIDRKLKEYGNKDEFLKNIQNLYGWNLDEFKERIVKPDMYKEKLAQSVKKADEKNIKAKQKIEEARKSLQDKNDFESVVRNYSEGDSAKNGGDLGWLSADQMLPELAEISFSLKKGETSDIIESALGFHIISMNDKKTEKGVDKVKISQVFVRVADFSEWLSSQEKNIKIYIPLKDFYWNSEAGMVEFTDSELKQFENNLEKNSAGDISVLF